MGSVLKTQISQRKLANLFLLILNGARSIYSKRNRGVSRANIHLTISKVILMALF